MNPPGAPSRSATTTYSRRRTRVSSAGPQRAMPANLSCRRSTESKGFFSNNIPYSSQRKIKAVVRSHNEEHISIILSHETHIRTFRHTPPFSQSAYSNSKPKITWNNAFSVKPKHKNSQIKIIRFTHPQPSLRKLSSSTDVLTHVHTQLMTGIIFIKN